MMQDRFFGIALVMAVGSMSIRYSSQKQNEALHVVVSAWLQVTVLDNGTTLFSALSA